MKRAAVALALAATALGAAPVWEKHLASGSYSFHHPAGWKVVELESMVEITRAASQEEILFLALPFDKGKSPKAMALKMVDQLRPSMPDIMVTGFQPGGETSITFQCAYTEVGKAFRSEVLVVKDTGSAHWFSYTAPAEGYDQDYGLDLLRSVVGSIAPGGASRVPDRLPARGRGDSQENNAKAFLFVLEFTLGAPLSQAQERLILAELLAGWQTQPKESLKPFDLYPQVVTAILGADQPQLESLRRELEASTREWLEESDPGDRVVMIVKTQLEAKGRILAAGKPPLTEMALAAYAEMTAYATLLGTDRNAPLSRLQPTKVEEQRQRLLGAWGALSPAEREDVLSTPGLWTTFRTLLQFGTIAEKSKTQAQLLRLTTSPAKPMGLVQHAVLMNINQATFNSYLWSRGFKSTMLGY